MRARALVRSEARWNPVHVGEAISFYYDLVLVVVEHHPLPAAAHFVEWHEGVGGPVSVQRQTRTRIRCGKRYALVVDFYGAEAFEERNEGGNQDFPPGPFYGIHGRSVTPADDLRGTCHDSSMSERVVIIGAGMAGLAAAVSLREVGVQPVLVDKSRAVGGRMSTRTIGDARFDQGAQHLGIVSDSVAKLLEPANEAGVMREWFRTRDGRARYVGVGGMRRIPEFMARNLDVFTGTPVERLTVDDGRVTVHAGSQRFEGSAAVVTPPLPQSLALLKASGIEVADPTIGRVDYRACLAVMAHLDAPSGLPDGHLTLDDGAIGWMADNGHKGTSEVPSLTIHSTSAFAMEHLEDEPEAWVDLLLDAAQPFLESRVVSATGHRWRYAEPASVLDVGSIVLEKSPPLVLAGEVFAGAKVEGAALSGLSAARAVLDLLA